MVAAARGNNPQEVSALECTGHQGELNLIPRVSVPLIS